MNCSSLMMVTYNRLELTEKTLKSLFETTHSEFRLIIVDNASTDGTVEFLKNSQDIRDLIESNKNCVGQDFQFNEKNLGIAIGRNQALKIANKYNDPFLSTLDNDVEFVPDWLNKCLDFLSVNPKFMIGLNYEHIQYPILTRNGKQFAYKRLGNLGTATTVFPRDLHNKIGYFIQEYGLYSCDDSDWGFRARLAGYEMAYLPEDGVHLGEGELDIGAYRKFKDKAHNEIAPRFRKSCGEYISGKRPLYISFE